MHFQLEKTVYGCKYSYKTMCISNEQAHGQSCFTHIVLHPHNFVGKCYHIL